MLFRFQYYTTILFFLTVSPLIFSGVLCAQAVPASANASGTSVQKPEAQKTTAPKRKPKRKELTPEQQERLDSFARMAQEGGQDSQGAPNASVRTNGNFQAPTTSGYHGSVARPRPIVLDKQLIAQNKLNIIETPHLILVTDMPWDEDLKLWPEYTNQLIERLCAYFEIDKKQAESWQITAFLMKNNVPFMMSDLLPDFIPQFEYGFSYNSYVWLFYQESRDYQRHLFLHECTHSFMNHFVGGCGPVWYGEGLAEYFGTHRIVTGKLETGIIPRSRNEFPHWGRIKYIQNDLQNGVFVPLFGMLTSDLKSQDTRSYSWAWAMIWMMSAQPEYKANILKMSKQMANINQQAASYRDRSDLFNELYRGLYDDAQWLTYCSAWAAFVSELDYGCSLSSVTIADKPVHPLSRPATITVQTNQGWQNTGVQLEQGKTYRIKAQGKFIVRKPQKGISNSKLWPCEPNGVTIRYVHQLPLGILLGAVVVPDEGFNEKPAGFNNPIPIGYEKTWTVEETGALWLKINESPAERSDNSGTISVDLEIVEPAKQAEAEK